tara:strand:+ start:1221 stop:2180 length:960 start_codon:yes stop_codon:yes gene_type:complete
MSTIKLKGSSSGEAEVTVAAAAGTPTFTLPTTVGSANQLLKNSGTAGTLEYASNLTYDGSKLVIAGTNSTNYLYLKNTSASDGSGARWNSIRFQGTQSGGEVSDLVQLQANHDGTADDEKGAFQVLVNDGNDGDSLQERLRVQSDGNVKINDGDLIIGTSGHGIDFSATSDAGGMTSELLDTYEEGTWSPQIYYQDSGDNGDASNLASYGWYTRVGNVCHMGFFLRWTLTGSAANDNIGVKNLPFTISAITSTYGHAGAVGTLNTSGTGQGTSQPLTLLATGNGDTFTIISDPKNTGNYGDELGAGTGLRVWGSLTYRV